MQIIITVSNNLENDQRVNKEATSLMRMGHDVEVLGCKSRPCTDYKKEYKTTRLDVWRKKGILFYLEITLRYLVYLITHKADAILCCDTDTILPAFIASRLTHRKLIVDLHELFPEVPEVVDRPLVKWVWQKIEDLTLPHCEHTYTVCQSIADYYNNRYGINMRVVRNMPNYIEYEGKQSTDIYPQIPQGKRVILYQGAINVGRGIEWIMEAMKYIDDAVLVVAGLGDLYDELRTRAESEMPDRVIFLGHIPYTVLRRLTLTADLGLCILQAKGLSYYYSLPNRISDLASTHVPILATDFPEIRRIVAHYGTGRLISHYEPEYLAEVVNEMLKQDVDHEKFATAARDLCWENEEKVLRDIIADVEKELKQQK